MKLSSGREVYANGDIFGLTHDGRLTEGYDGFIYDDDEAPMTREERIEIANEMIGRWQAFKDRALKKEGLEP